MIKTQTQLQKEDIRLREITLADTEFVLKLRNNPDVRKWFHTSTPITAESHQQFLQNYFSSQNSEEIYLIEKADHLIGMISLYNISNGRAEWGRVAVLPEFQGQGVGRAALSLIIQRAKELGLDQLYCSVVKTNTKAKNLYQSLGFQVTHEDEISAFLELDLKSAATGN